MGLQENFAETIRRLMMEQKKSLTEFSEELEISRSMLQEYLKARGNPSIATIEHMAQKLNMEPITLLSGMFALDQREVALLLLETIQSVADLEGQKKIRFAELFLEMMELWSEK